MANSAYTRGADAAAAMLGGAAPPFIPEDTSFEKCGDWRRARVVTKWLLVTVTGSTKSRSQP